MQVAGGKQQYKVSSLKAEKWKGFIKFNGQGVMDAYLTIKRQEGVVGGLYRGTVPNIGRNCIINVGETVVYDAVKVGHCHCTF